MDMIDRLFKTALFRETTRDLKRAELLSSLLAHPERSFPTVHIAGTNGKGSVATKIAKALEYSGLKVGLYTSPHLSSFRERIAVQGVLISEEAAVEGLGRIFSLADTVSLQPTYFELITFLAFDYFRKEKVDVAVIETGLGGRLDATNVITPLLSIITSISRDHTAVLGQTLEEIAAEKAGIIKPHIPVVIGSRSAYRAIFDKATNSGCPLFRAAPAEGFYDRENREIAHLALSLLAHHFSLTAVGVERGLQMRPPCRFESIGEAILDVAHNPDGFRQLCLALEEHFPHRSFRFLIGMSKDKEWEACFAILVKKAAHIHLVEAPSSRALATEELERGLTALNYTSFSSEKSIAAGVSEAKKSALEREEVLVICGSFYIMSEAREALMLPLLPCRIASMPHR